MEKGEDWKNEWHNFAVDAGCTKEFEKNALVKFLTRLTAKASAVDALGSSRVQAVMSVLRDGGEGANLELRLEKALRVSEAGDEHAQSRDARTICIIYLAELPGGDWLEWYGARADLSSLGISQLPTIDIRKSERCVKVHKDTNCTSFQRALADKTGYKLSTYFQLVSQLLGGNGLALACNRWQRIKAKIDGLFSG